MGGVFLALSKVLDWLLAPFSWALLLMLLALVSRARPRRAFAATALALVILVVFSTEAVKNRLDRWAEASAPATYRPEVVYDAAVVLGGMVDLAATLRSGELELDEHADRILKAYDLVRSGRVKNVLISAGNAGLRPGEPSEADLLAGLLSRWGVPASQIVVEGRSRNTRENAIEAARLASDHGWHSLVLVTSAVHMPRALGCFRAVGLSPDTLPVDRRAVKGLDQAWLPRVLVLSASTDVLRELAGRLVYRVVGYTK
jgi:uncharacterized SAM-binding protein YcdF (DUF218 family)